MADELDAARLDALERLHPSSWLRQMAGPAFIAAARKALHLRGLVDAHNALMATRCATSFCEDHTANPDLDRLGEREICAGCPRDNMIDAADAAPGEVSRAAAP